MMFVYFLSFPLFFICQCALVLFSVFCFNFVINWLISFLVSFAYWVTLFYYVFFGLLWFHLCVCVCVCVCALLILFLLVWFVFYHLSGVYFCSLLFCSYFFFGFWGAFVHFNPLYWLVGSLIPNQQSGLTLSDGSVISRTLDCQRTPGPREY